MSLISDIAADWSLIEGVETVTLIPQNPSGAEIKGVKALRKSIGPAGLSNAGVFATDPSDDAWHLWEATLQGVEPKPGDHIRDASGTIWSITTIGYSNRSSRYILTARQHA